MVDGEWEDYRGKEKVGILRGIRKIISTLCYPHSILESLSDINHVRWMRKG